MKKSIVMFLAVLMSITLATIGLAMDKVSGEVVKTEGEFIIVKDAMGKEHKFHMDKTTKQMGDVKAGSHVEVEATDKGHASMIMGKEAMGMGKEGMKK